MPRGRAKPVGVRAPDDATQEHLAAPHEGVSADDLTVETERVLAELGENVSAVVVYRMKDNKPGEWDFVARVPATEFTPDYIKEQYGGGDYKVVVIDAVQGPLNPVFFSVDRRFVGKVWATTNPAAVVAQGTGDPFRDRLLEVLLANALKPQPTPQNNTKEMMELMLAVVAAMKSGNSDSASVMEQVTAMVTTATTLAQAMNPPEGLAGLAAGFLPVIERLVPANAPRAARATHQITRPAAPNPPVSSTPTMTTEVQPPARVAGSIVPKWLAPFKPIVGMVVKLADRGSDPTTYADMALDELEDNEDTFKAAVEAMNEGRLLSDFFAVAPDMQLTDERREFATALVQRITEGLREMLDAQTETAADNGEGEAAHG